MSPALRICVLLIGVAGGACAPAPRPSAEADAAAIVKVREEFAAAWKAADAERVAALFASDAVLMPPNEPAARGRPAIAAYFKTMFAEMTPASITLVSDEVKTFGDWAFDRGSHMLTLRPKDGGAPVTDEGKYLVLLQRQPDGAWQVARDAWNNNEPAAAPSMAPSMAGRK